MTGNEDGPGKEKSDGNHGNQVRGEGILPRDFNPVEAIDPRTGKPWQLYVRNNTVALTAKKGTGHARELAFTVLETVQHPKAVYRGMTELDGDDGDEDWLIYIGLPAWAYDYKTGKQVKAWKGEVFLVFVDEDKVIRRWKWDEADTPHNPHLPLGHDGGRFLEKLL